MYTHLYTSINFYLSISLSIFICLYLYNDTSYNDTLLISGFLVRTHLHRRHTRDDLSIYLYLHLSIYLNTRLYIHLCTSIYIYLSISVAIFIYLYLDVDTSFYLGIPSAHTPAPPAYTKWPRDHRRAPTAPEIQGGGGGVIVVCMYFRVDPIYVYLYT